MQSRWMSAVEAKTNLLIGFAISWFLTVYAVPVLFGIQVSAEQGLGIVTLFTVSSFVRQYLVRRWFVKLERYQLGHIKRATPGSL